LITHPKTTPIRLRKLRIGFVLEPHLLSTLPEIRHQH
jgi:hypothetical protein